MEPATEKAALGIKEILQYTSLSRAHLYRLFAEGLIPSFHIGRRRLVLKKDLDVFLEEMMEREEDGVERSDHHVEAIMRKQRGH
jgi:excisionase family DNA binding protein